MSALSICAIQRAIAAEFGTSRDEIKSQRRGRDVAWPRQYSYWLCRKMLPLSLPVIALHHGGRDHTTVLYGVRMAQERVEADFRLYLRLSRVCRSLTGFTLVEWADRNEPVEQVACENAECRV